MLARFGALALGLAATTPVLADAPSPLPAPPAGGAGSVTVQQLAGDWVSDCYRRGGSDRRDVIHFEGAGVTYQRVYFTEPGCATVDFLYTVGGSYRLGGPVAALKDTWTLDVTVESADLTLFDGWLAQAFRQERYCGHSYWPVREPLPMLGDVCGDEKEPQFYAGQIRQDVVHVDVTSHVPRLYFGDPSGLFTEGPLGARATGIDLDRVFKKDVP